MIHNFADQSGHFLDTRQGWISCMIIPVTAFIILLAKLLSRDGMRLFQARTMEIEPERWDQCRLMSMGTFLVCLVQFLVYSSF